MSYITTYTGKHFDPIQPEPGLFDLTDISHALSLLCRGNGHMKHFYSVAQHSIACAEEAKARGYSARVQLGCLLHDASEAYLSDVTRPVKKRPGLLSKSGSAASGSSVGVFYSGTGFERRGTRTGF